MTPCIPVVMYMPHTYTHTYTHPPTPHAPHPPPQEDATILQQALVTTLQAMQLLVNTTPSMLPLMLAAMVNTLLLLPEGPLATHTATAVIDMVRHAMLTTVNAGEKTPVQVVIDVLTVLQGHAEVCMDSIAAGGEKGTQSLQTVVNVMVNLAAVLPQVGCCLCCLCCLCWVLLSLGILAMYAIVQHIYTQEKHVHSTDGNSALTHNNDTTGFVNDNDNDDDDFGDFDDGGFGDFSQGGVVEASTPAATPIVAPIAGDMGVSVCLTWNTDAQHMAVTLTPAAAAATNTTTVNSNATTHTTGVIATPTTTEDGAEDGNGDDVGVVNGQQEQQEQQEQQSRDSNGVVQAQCMVLDTLTAGLTMHVDQISLAIVQVRV